MDSVFSAPPMLEKITKLMSKPISTATISSIAITIWDFTSVLAVLFKYQECNDSGKRDEVTDIEDTKSLIPIILRLDFIFLHSI